jgi:hypothetical protein
MPDLGTRPQIPAHLPDFVSRQPMQFFLQVEFNSCPEGDKPNITGASGRRSASPPGSGGSKLIESAVRPILTGSSEINLHTWGKLEYEPSSIFSR